MNVKLPDGEPPKSSRVMYCWEFKRCTHLHCPMYLNESAISCYYVFGTLGGESAHTVTSKIDECRKCDYYQYSEKYSLELRKETLQRLKRYEDELQGFSIVSREEKSAIFKQRAEYLRARTNYREPEAKVRMLTFAIGAERYCIRIQHALEIISAAGINKIPCTPPHFAGIINLRGTILTLIDLGGFLGIEKSSPLSSATAIVVEVDGKIAGLLVDKVENILDIGVGQVSSPLSTLKGVSEAFIEGEVLTEERPLTLLNLEKMMKHEDMKVFEMVNPNL